MSLRVSLRCFLSIVFLIFGVRAAMASSLESVLLGFLAGIAGGRNGILLDIRGLTLCGAQAHAASSSPVRGYSGLMPAALMTLAHLTISDLIYAANSTGVPPTGS